MITTTAHRVSENTTPAAAARIREATQARIAYFAKHPDAIPRRLHELDREWDVERVLETGSSSLTLLGLVLGTTYRRKWLLLSLGVQAFFFQHAIQGWCPPLPVLRRMGVRTAQEIEGERCVLRQLLAESTSRRHSPEATDAQANVR